MIFQTAFRLGIEHVMLLLFQLLNIPGRTTPVNLKVLSMAP